MESTIAQKLEALLKLQEIDSKLDALLKIRGDLPEEVRDLEDETLGYQTRKNKFLSEIEELNGDLQAFSNAQKDAEKLILKYKDQQMNVRNNREFDAISKEIELQELDVNLAEKRSNETRARIRLIEDELEKINQILSEREEALNEKKGELEVIVEESREEEKQIRASREKQTKKIEERLLKSYDKIRTNSLNGLAVVQVSRGACGGCFNIGPPQRQADIRDNKRIIVCEHCGRILADVEAPVPASK